MNDDSVSVCVSKIVALASSFLLALTSLIGRSLGSTAVPAVHHVRTINNKQNADAWCPLDSRIVLLLPLHQSLSAAGAAVVHWKAKQQGGASGRCWPWDGHYKSILRPPG
jgi:hypothetical protein